MAYTDWNGRGLSLSGTENTYTLSQPPSPLEETGGLRKLVGKLDRDMDDLLKSVKELRKLINSKKNCQ